MAFWVMAALIVLLDIVTFRGIKITFPKFADRRKRGLRIAVIVQVLFSLTIVLGGFFLNGHIRDYRLFALYYYLFGLMLALYLPKVLFALFLMIDWPISALSRRKRRSRYSASRKPRHISAKFGFAVCLLLTCLVVWGILFGRHDYTINPVEVKFDSLPPAFDGYKIVQISDVHAGSFFGFTGRFQKAVEMINAQNPDLIVFTGDMVNNFAEEAYPLIPVFSELKARDGKYAVLGNHDYGVYYEWETCIEEETNLEELEQAITRMGFDLLNNRAVVLTKGNLDRIALVGVENWGIAKRHPKKGDIEQATDSVRNIPFKILLSHDPSFWTEKIEGKTDIALTLSGHTHGGQVGIKFRRKYYGPSMIEYPYWSGLYQVGNQYLYVNRGLGVIGYPGRIGILPEITVITLRSEN